MNKKMHHLPFSLLFHSTASMVQLVLQSNWLSNLSLTHLYSLLFSGDCLDRSCSHHGTCSEGVCYCDLGWMGETCSLENSMIQACLPDCSGHGSYDVSAGHCRYPLLSLFISEITIYFIWTELLTLWCTLGIGKHLFELYVFNYAAVHISWEEYMSLKYLQKLSGWNILYL